MSVTSISTPLQPTTGRETLPQLLIDGLADRATSIVRICGDATVCLLQRRFSLSHSHAVTVMEELERRGVVRTVHGIRLVAPVQLCGTPDSQLGGVSLMTEVERFVAAVRAALGPEEINRSGATLYSAARTLQSGDVYLLGTNPGGADIGKNTIAQSLEVLPTLTSNSYLDEAWDKNPQAIGQAAMQRRVKALLEGILQEPAEVCASNLIFMRTPSIGQLDFWKSARICWPAHEVALDIVQPRLLIAFGNSETSTYAFLHAVLPMVGDEVVFPADHGNWSCRGFHSTWRGQPMYVAGLPHLSYYALLDEAGKAKEHVISWLLEKLRAPATNK